MSDQDTEYAEEVFEDAVQDECPKDLHSSIQAACLAANLFFNNRYEEAHDILRPWAHQSMYHALGNSTLLFLQAILTFDPKNIEAASEALRQSVELCSKFRRKATIGESIGKIVKKTDYSCFTEEEMHAELCYAEMLLLKSVLSFIEDETLISFVKGGIKIRQCYQSYKDCWYMLESRKFEESQEKIHFESGVRMGVGSFNLLISQLPAKVLKLLEFVGFSGNKYLGLSELVKGFELTGSLRRVLCAIVLLGANLVFIPILGTADSDMELTERVLEDQLKMYPDGCVFLYFKGRFHYIRGEFDEASRYYELSRQSQATWKQFHHICYWDLMWCCIMTAQWRTATKYAKILVAESRWSKATYAYIKSCCMCMMADELTDEERKDLSESMRSIPGLRQRIAGKSLPMEKMAARKSARFFAQNESLTLSGLELIYLWNGYNILGKNFEAISRMFTIIDKERQRLEALPASEQGEYHMDNVLLTYHLKGCCLSHMKSPFQAAECFSYVVSNEKKLKDDKYLVPSSLTEIALLHLSGENKDLNQARTILEYAKTNYKGHSFESRLNFRIHSTIYKIKCVQKGMINMDGSTPVDYGTSKLSTSNKVSSKKYKSGLKSSSSNGGSAPHTNGGSADVVTSEGLLAAPQDESPQYPGISRSPSPFSPTDDTPFEDLAPQTDLNVDGLCNLKVS